LAIVGREGDVGLAVAIVKSAATIESRSEPEKVTIRNRYDRWHTVTSGDTP
jgi:hypothetical protein